MKAKLAYGTMRNQCAGCGALFMALGTFDAHRVGAFGVDRRCLTPDEMIERGFGKDTAGNWRSDAGCRPSVPSQIRAPKAWIAGHSHSPEESILGAQIG